MPAGGEGISEIPNAGAAAPPVHEDPFKPQSTDLPRVCRERRAGSAAGVGCGKLAQNSAQTAPYVVEMPWRRRLDTRPSSPSAAQADAKSARIRNGLVAGLPRLCPAQAAETVGESGASACCLRPAPAHRRAYRNLTVPVNVDQPVRPAPGNSTPGAGNLWIAPSTLRVKAPDLRRRVPDQPSQQMDVDQSMQPSGSPRRSGLSRHLRRFTKASQAQASGR
jgi:hypothetical protein